MKNDELFAAEDLAMDAALKFLCRNPTWNFSHEALASACDKRGLDADLVGLAATVLFGPATVYISTGKSV